MEWRDLLRACKSWKAAVQLIAKRAGRARQNLVSLTSSQGVLLPTSSEGQKISVLGAERQEGIRLLFGIRFWTQLASKFCATEKVIGSHQVGIPEIGISHTKLLMLCHQTSAQTFLLAGVGSSSTESQLQLLERVYLTSS